MCVSYLLLILSCNLTNLCCGYILLASEIVSYNDTLIDWMLFLSAASCPNCKDNSLSSKPIINKIASAKLQSLFNNTLTQRQTRLLFIQADTKCSHASTVEVVMTIPLSLSVLVNIVQQTDKYLLSTQFMQNNISNYHIYYMYTLPWTWITHEVEIELNAVFLWILITEKSTHHLFTSFPALLSMYSVQWIFMTQSLFRIIIILLAFPKNIFHSNKQTSVCFSSVIWGVYGLLTGYFLYTLWLFFSFETIGILLRGISENCLNLPKSHKSKHNFSCFSDI